LDGTGTSSGDVRGLAALDGDVSLWANTPALDEIASVANNSGSPFYLHYVYPARYTQTVKFWLNGIETGFVLENASLNVENASGFTEAFKHYRSPEAYVNFDLAFKVTI